MSPGLTRWATCFNGCSFCLPVQDIQCSSRFYSVISGSLPVLKHSFCCIGPALPQDPWMMSHWKFLSASSTSTVRIVHQNWATSALSVLPPKLTNPKSSQVSPGILKALQWCSVPKEAGSVLLYSLSPCPAPGDLPILGIEPRSPTLQILYQLSH